MTLNEFLLARIADDSRKHTNDRDTRRRIDAECAAKCRIVELHRDCDDVAYGDDSTCPELRALATVYADHPDYRQEWAL